MHRYELSLSLTLVLIVLAAGAYAQEQYPYSVLFLSFKDISTDKTITETPASLRFTNLDLDTKTSITRILDKDGVSRYELRAGNWNLEAIIDVQHTPEADYYAQTLFRIEEEEFVNNKSVYLTPVGAVEGIVIDNSNNRINGAELQFNCKSNEHSPYPLATDQFGSFIVEMVPVGKCKISAAYQGRVGTETVKIEHGELVEVTVNLDKSIVEPQSSFWYIVTAILFVLLMAAGGYIWKLRKKPLKEAPKEEQLPKEANVPTPEKIEEPNPRARDVIATLKDNEKNVVEFLLNAGNGSTQAKIRNATGIPKTTLARCFLELEKKKVLQIEKIGKMKKIALTNWFLGKE